MIIQVIGLPCSGKSSVLKKIKKDLSFIWIDKAKLSNSLIDSDLSEIAICLKPHNVIIESACGYLIPNSIIVLLKISSKELSKRKHARDYISSFLEEETISDNMCPADYTAYSTRDLEKILRLLLRG